MKVKVVLTVFFDFNGIVHHEFLLQIQTIYMEYYLQVKRCLREIIKKKTSRIVTKQNNVHISLLIREYFAKN